MLTLAQDPPQDKLAIESNITSYTTHLKRFLPPSTITTTVYTGQVGLGPCAVLHTKQKNSPAKPPGRQARFLQLPPGRCERWMQVHCT